MKDPQTQLFVPSPDERATALHQEIDDLSRRLHTIVDEAADAQRLEDEEGEELVPIRRSELRLLLDLASQSPDLVGRSGFAWDRNDPVWHEMGEEFSRRLLADLASRVDLSYSDFTRILGKIYGDDPDDLDDSEVELPEAVGATLVRAWSRSDRGYSERDTCVADAWPRLDWGAVPCTTLSEVLGEAVAHGLAERRTAELAHWFERVAPLVYPDLSDRLLWFVETVGKPHGDGPSLPEEINTSLTEYISAWLTALQSRPIEDIAVVVRAFRRTAMSACIYRPDIDVALDTLSEAY